jgi:hypothetical protein
MGECLCNITLFWTNIKCTPIKRDSLGTCFSPIITFVVGSCLRRCTYKTPALKSHHEWIDFWSRTMMRFLHHNNFLRHHLSIRLAWFLGFNGFAI